MTMDPQANNGETLLLDAGAVARQLSVSPKTVRRLDEGGKLPSPLRIGRLLRWRRAELEAWVVAGMPARDEWSWAGCRPGAR